MRKGELGLSSGTEKERRSSDVAVSMMIMMDGNDLLGCYVAVFFLDVNVGFRGSCVS